MFPWNFNPYPAPDFWFGGWPALESPDMSETSTPSDAPTVIHAAPMFKKVTNDPPPPHTWGRQQRFAPGKSLSGHEQLEWECARCHLVKITLMPKGEKPCRRYRRPCSGEQFYAASDPACVPDLTDLGCRP